MTFDFDTPIQRAGTDSQKWQKYAGRDVLPMWVADMDFKSPPAVIAAIQARVADGVYGYARPVKSSTDAVVNALAARYGWKIDPSWLVWLPGLVVGLNVAAQAFAAVGDEVLTLTPIYPPFMTAPKNSGRISVPVPFTLNAAAARWEIDWAALERAITPRTKMFYLCNPHNPLARVWRREELVQLADFCVRHNLLLCSDENPTAFSLGFRAWLQQHPRYTLMLLVPAELLTVPQAWALLGYRHVVFGNWSF